jgi:hypothetical protein
MYWLNRIRKASVTLLYFGVAFSAVQKVIHNEVFMVNMGYSEFFPPDIIPYLAYLIPIIGVLGCAFFLLEFKRIQWAQVLLPTVYILFYFIYNQLVYIKMGSSETCACSFLLPYFGFMTNQIASGVILFLFFSYALWLRNKNIEVKSAMSGL